MHWVRHTRSLTFVAPQSKFPCGAGHSILIRGSTQIRHDGLKIDSNVDLFMYLIEGIRFGTWKVRHLNWTKYTRRLHINHLIENKFTSRANKSAGCIKP